MIFDNKVNKVGEDLKKNIEKGDKIDIAASIFSIYGYETLKKQLNKIDRMRFIFIDPTFVEEENNKKEHRQFKLNAIERKLAIGGSYFEINLKNEMKGKALAKECKNWIKKKVKFKSNRKKEVIQPNFNIYNQNKNILYIGINEFSSAGFGYKNDNTIFGFINKITNKEITKEYLKKFEEIWNDEKILKDITNDVLEYLSNLYKENSPEKIYHFILYNIFNEFLLEVSEDELANEKTGFKDSIIWNMLYDFQKDAVLGIINKLERHNGCILADSVGLGKTFTALGVIKYYQERNKNILVLCPKKLGNNWLTFTGNYEDNPLIKDRFNYDVLYHTDLLRESGYSNGKDLSRINWSNYDLIVIDESHNFRNNNARKEKKTRYTKLLEDVIKKGVKTKVLMLSATPVNNKFNDLKNQLALAYEGETNKINEKLGVEKSIDTILRRAQQIFNEWSKLPIEKRTGNNLLKMLNSHFDFFKLLDEVTIARSRKHIERYYDVKKLGKFPKRLKPVNVRSEITNLPDFMGMKELYKRLSYFNLAIYAPSMYILPTKKAYYEKKYDTIISKNLKFRQEEREISLKKLVRIIFLKRLESSIDSFRITLKRFSENIKSKLDLIEEFKTGKNNGEIEIKEIKDTDFEEDEEYLNEEFNVGGKIKINLIDIDFEKWEEDLLNDYKIATEILKELEKITPEYDSKLNELKRIIDNKIENPINPDNKKILIFTAFSDTAEYLYEHISKYVKEKHNLETAKISGDNKNRSTLPIRNEFNNILINFSPKSKGRRDNTKPEIDILIATDCISEGQNLQDCDTLINYDIHWNPTRIIQRFGRIDRIGSKNEYIQLINFWPQISLDEYIKLKSRVEARMYIVDMSATGEENILTNESVDLSFRKKQLERLQNEIIDLEEMNSGISITDLGLNDFRMDLINYIKNNKLEDLPKGIHAVCKKDISKGIEEGVIFILKNINTEINIDKINQLHPFYLVYIKENGEVLSNHLNVKKTLDIIRAISKGYDEPIKEVYQIFNEETNDGKNMEKYTNLLNKCIESILNVKEEKEVDSLFSEGGTTALLNNIKGLEDFELIAFVVIK
ncbi:helicase [Marinitoga sp. 1155]|nr:helicase [Marinitoga sp. 1155]